VELYEQADDELSRTRPPSLLNTLTELPRTLMEMGSLLAFLPLLSRLPRGDQHPVLLLPGFMASDESTTVIRRYLLRMGYEPLPWSLGRNTGRMDLLDGRLTDRFEHLTRIYDCKISIIGQSLGGVYAREIARRFPHHVRQVITLGSPFGTRQASSTNPLVARLFRQQSGMTVEEMRDHLTGVQRGSPVPSTAIYSRGDGVVNWRVCREEDGPVTESVEVPGSHCGMGFNPLIYLIVADRLSLPSGEWRKFDCSMLHRFALPGSFGYVMGGFPT
jgi:pimeloyl-ACP methyl ester carboxylesterase